MKKSTKKKQTKKLTKKEVHALDYLEKSGLADSKMLEDINKQVRAKGDLEEVLNTTMRESFTEGEMHITQQNCFDKLTRKYNCIVSPGKPSDPDDGYLILELPQIDLRLLYIKVFGGRGFFGKKIHYAAYLQHFDEQHWSPSGTFKYWTLAMTGINNIFRHEGLLRGSAT